MLKPLRADLPYPSIEDLKPDPVAARIVAPAYAGQKSELAAICQYIYHDMKFEGENLPAYAHLMEEISVTEMHHFDLLGSMLQKLGVDPVMTECPPFRTKFFSTQCVSFSCTPVKMLMDDIDAETNAIAEYERMLTLLGNETVAAVIQRIVMDEKMHLAALTEMLEKWNNR